MEDEAQHVHQELGGEKRRRSRVVVVGRDLDKVDADDVALLGEPLKDLQDFIVEKTAVARCSRARRDRRVKAIDIDGRVLAYAVGNAVEHALGAQAADIADRQDIGTRFARGGVVVAV